MSKRHQTSRRKSYGRRQHELRQRGERYDVRQRIELGWDDPADGPTGDAFSFLDAGRTRLRYALGD